jgi:glycine cleavage system regulatory protein
MSTEKIIITLFAKDRPGIVRAVSQAMLNHDSNWLESSLSRLCGQFTGIIHLEVSDINKPRLLKEFASMSEDGIFVTVQNAQGVSSDNQEVNGLQILVEANDRPGIVKEITEALAVENVNVDNIDTEVESASMAGYPIFRAHMFLAMPDDLSEDDLADVLEGVSDDVMVSILEE